MSSTGKKFVCVVQRKNRAITICSVFYSQNLSPTGRTVISVMLTVVGVDSKYKIAFEISAGLRAGATLLILRSSGMYLPVWKKSVSTTPGLTDYKNRFRMNFKMKTKFCTLTEILILELFMQISS